MLSVEKLLQIKLRNYVVWIFTNRLLGPLKGKNPSYGTEIFVKNLIARIKFICIVQSLVIQSFFFFWYGLPIWKKWWLYLLICTGFLPFLLWAFDLIFLKTLGSFLHPFSPSHSNFFVCLMISDGTIFQELWFILLLQYTLGKGLKDYLER